MREGGGSLKWAGRQRAGGEELRGRGGVMEREGAGQNIGDAGRGAYTE